MRLRTVLTALALVLPSECFAAQSGNWSIDYLHESGQKSGCMMQTGYKSGIQFGLAVYKDYSWALGLSSDDWNLKAGDTTDVAAYIDGRLVATGRATFISSKLAFMPLQKAEVYRALQAGHVLELITPSGKLTFALTGTARAMTTVLDCVATIAPTTQNAAQNNSDSPATSAEDGSVGHAEATVMLTNMLNSAGVTGYRLSPPSSDKSKDGQVEFVMNDGSTGMFSAVRGTPANGADEIAAAILQGAATACAGAFKSGKQPVNTTDGSVVRKAIAECKIGDRSTVSDTTIVRRADGQLYFLAHVYQDVANSLNEPSSRSENSPLTEAAVRFDPGR